MNSFKSIEGNVFNSVKASSLIRALNKVIEKHGDKNVAMFIINKEEGVMISPISTITIRDIGYTKDNMNEFICITNESNPEAEDI